MAKTHVTIPAIAMPVPSPAFRFLAKLTPDSGSPITAQGIAIHVPTRGTKAKRKATIPRIIPATFIQYSSLSSTVARIITNGDTPVKVFDLENSHKDNNRAAGVGLHVYLAGILRNPDLLHPGSRYEHYRTGNHWRSRGLRHREFLVRAGCRVNRKSLAPDSSRASECRVGDGPLAERSDDFLGEHEGGEVGVGPGHDGHDRRIRHV